MTVHRTQGTRAFCSNDLEESKRCFQKAIAEDPCDWESHVYLAMTYTKLGMLVQAKESFAHVLSHTDEIHWREAAKLALALESVGEAIAQLHEQLAEG